SIGLNRVLAKLSLPRPASRDRAAAEIADLLDADALDGAQVETAARSLMEAALREAEPAARESMFNALSSASMAPSGDRVNWDPVASSLDGLRDGCLEHALVILGFSRNAQYRPKIEQYLRHKDETIRTTAAEALTVLGTGKRPKAC